MSPIEELQVAVEQTFSNIFSGGDINEAKAAFSEQLQALGGSISRADLLIEAMGAIGSLLVENPTDAQKAEIGVKIAKFSSEGVKFVESQPGLENASVDSDIISDENFTRFSSTYAELKKQADYLSLHPEGSYDYFTIIPEEYAKFVVTMVQASKDVQAKKAAASE